MRQSDAMFEPADLGIALYIILIFVVFISASSWVRYSLHTEGTTHARHGMRGLPPLKENPGTTEGGEA